MPKAKLKTKGIPSPRHYVYPDTNILKNKYGEKDLKLFMEKCSHDIEEAKKVLRKEPLPEFFDSNYICHIHRQFFENTFEWAGQMRTVPFTFEDGSTADMPEMKKEEWGIAFARNEDILEQLAKFEQTLAEKNNLQGLTREEFNAEAVELFISLKRIHPFIDGNEQVAEFFFERLARAAGMHRLHFSLVPTKRMMTAYSEALQHGNPEPMRHIFEDISNIDKTLLLQDFMYNMKQREHDINECNFMVAKEGITYLGTYQFDNSDSFVVDTQGIYIVCDKKHLPPEQIKTLKPGDIITFTAPKNEEFEKILIPKETLAPLTESEFSDRVAKNPRVEAAVRKVQHLSKLIYDRPKVLDEYIGEIFKNPDSGKNLADRIQNHPGWFSPLVGTDFLFFKSQTRTNAEKLLKQLGSAIINCTEATLYARHTVTNEHQIEKERRSKAVERPSQNLQNLFFLSPEKQREVLSQNPHLYKELRTLVYNIEQRLSSNEYNAIKKNDYATLAKSIGVSEHKAREISDTVNKAKKAHENFHIRSQNRSNTLAMAS
ncbi:BID domain-containing T4SS effector [Candidatus Bartonella washoeensis]|uniref:protein adenylyltransferase n=1 Tax=Cardidatus Bartonella washoeensis 085-0475 TaxID=1094564 RepID=J1JPU6_9HYPH|nr:BID domain-containing T4SS effector [Bartonella washoeensis]EJF86812.1 hypothetical protein MCW_00035 [Bartonella washoeensis 085-0475]